MDEARPARDMDDWLARRRAGPVPGGGEGRRAAAAAAAGDSTVRGGGVQGLPRSRRARGGVSPGGGGLPSIRSRRLQPMYY